jgi:hypothetical protein
MVFVLVNILSGIYLENYFIAGLNDYCKRKDTPEHGFLCSSSLLRSYSRAALQCFHRAEKFRISLSKYSGQALVAPHAIFVIAALTQSRQIVNESEVQVSAIGSDPSQDLTVRAQIG